MRIVVITSFFYPDTVGGSDRAVYETSRALVERGHSVRVATQRHSITLPERDVVHGIEVQRYSRPRSSKLASNLGAMWGARQAVRDMLGGTQAADVVIGHHSTPVSGTLDVLAASDVPLVYYFHAPYHREYALDARVHAEKSSGVGKRVRQVTAKGVGGFRKWAEGQCLQRSALIYSASDYSKHFVLEDFRIPQCKVRLMPLGVDLDRFAFSESPVAARARLGLPSDAAVMLTVRRLEPRMGLENLLQALYLLKEQGLDRWRLLLVGKGALQATLDHRIEELDLRDHIRMEGFVPDGKLPRYYHAADYFLLPTSALECFGMVTLEALSSGTPVLATPVGATEEILSGIEPGWLAQDGTPEAICRLLVEKALNPPSAVTRRACRRFVELNYGWAKAVDTLEEGCLQIVEERKGR